MTTAYKTLAQLSPAANTLTTLYTTPAATQTVISSLCICNTNAVDGYFSVSIAVGGAADNGKQYIYSALPLVNHDTFIFTGGITLQATDLIRVSASETNISFNLFGKEIS